MGAVTDEAGGGIQGATVAFTDKSSQKFERMTDKNGHYLVPVPAGTYSVTAEYKGHKAWQTFFLKSFDVGDKSNLNLDITLKVDPNFVKMFGLDVTGEVSVPAASKLLDFSLLTRATVNEKLTPLWKTISCDVPFEIFVINYGSTSESRRRVKLIMESWGFKCEFTQFRGFVFVDGHDLKPRTVIWKVPKGAQPPEP